MLWGTSWLLHLIAAAEGVGRTAALLRLAHSCTQTGALFYSAVLAIDVCVLAHDTPCCCVVCVCCECPSLTRPSVSVVFQQTSVPSLCLGAARVLDRLLLGYQVLS